MQRVILYCATLGGGGAVLFAFSLWSVRWKDDQRRSKRCFLKPQRKNDVPNLCNNCRASGSIIFEWRNCIGISVSKYLGFKVGVLGKMTIMIAMCSIMKYCIFLSTSDRDVLCETL